MLIFQLIYRSKATSFFTDEDLITLLRQARENNTQKNITGLLLYGYGNFIQLLEGNEKEVKNLFFNHIEKDARHRDSAVLQQTFVEKRLFKDWSMAFQPLDSERVHDLKGYLEPHKKSGEDKNLLAPMRLLELMQGFSLAMHRR